MYQCHCPFNILLLNPLKKHSKKEIKRNYKRINNIIRDNITEFSEDSIKIAQQSLEAICNKIELEHHECSIIDTEAKLIKHKIKIKQIATIRDGTKSATALVPYYPNEEELTDNNNNPDIPLTEDPNGIPHPEIQREFEQDVYVISDEDDDILYTGESTVNKNRQNTNNQEQKNEVEIIKEKRTRKYSKRKRDKNRQTRSHKRIRERENEDGNDSEQSESNSSQKRKEINPEIRELLQKWIKNNRQTYNDSDEISEILGHWYKFERIKFRCGWKSGKEDTSEDTGNLLKKLKGNTEPLCKYLRTRTERSFNTILHRAPEVFIWMIEIERNRAIKEAIKIE